MGSRARLPRLSLVPLRVALITGIVTLLAFALSLLLGIVGMVAWGMIRSVHPDLRTAYRHVALPVAIGVAVIALIAATVHEIRHYRQAKTLAGIERAS